MKIKIKDIAVRAGGVSAGAVVAKMVNKFLPNLNPKIRAAAKIALGAVVPEFMPKVKIAGHVGDGFIAIGAAELVESFVPSMVSGNDIMAGPGDGPIAIDEDYDSVSSADYDDEVSGADDDDEVSGADDLVSGNDEDED